MHQKKYCFVSDSQHGFRPGKSTVTSNLIFSIYILDNVVVGSQVDAVFTDFKKAFFMVDYGKLLRILDDIRYWQFTFLLAGILLYFQMINLSRLMGYSLIFVLYSLAFFRMVILALCSSSYL